LSTVDVARKVAQMAAPASKIVRYQLVFHAPLAAVEACKAAIFAAGAGRYPGVGNYTECCWMTIGTGQFRPGDAANPNIGSVGVLEHVEEARVSALCVGEDVTRKAVAALKESVSSSPHPPPQSPKSADLLYPIQSPPIRGAIIFSVQDGGFLIAAGDHGNAESTGHIQEGSIDDAIGHQALKLNPCHGGPVFPASDRSSTGSPSLACIKFINPMCLL